MGHTLGVSTLEALTPEAQLAVLRDMSTEELEQLSVIQGASALMARRGSRARALYGAIRTEVARRSEQAPRGRWGSIRDAMSDGDN